MAIPIEHKIPFLDKDLKIYILETSLACKGIIIYFDGLPGAPANPALHKKITIKAKNTDIEWNSSSIGNDYFLTEGYHFVTFDYPGFWEAPFDFTIDNCIDAGKSVLKYLQQVYPQIPLYLYGFSLGTGISLLVTAQYNGVKKIFLQSPLPFDGSGELFCSYFESEEMCSGFLAFQQSMVDQGFVKNKADFRNMNEVEDFFKPLQLQKALEQVLEKNIPVKGILGKNDGQLSIPAVTKLYKNKIDFEIWDDLPHGFLSEDVNSKMMKDMVYFFK